MKLRAAMALLAAVTLATVACDSGGEVLVAVVQLESGVQATCVSLTVSDPDTARLLGEVHAVRADGKDDYQFAVYRKDLPAEVTLQAQALSGSGCAAPLSAVSSSEPATRTFSFVAGRVPLTVPRPPLGPDALEVQVPPVLAVGECTSASVQTTLQGAAVQAVVDTDIAFSISGTGLAAYTDGTCTAAASGATLAAGATSLAFQLRGAAPGSYTVTARTNGLGPGAAIVDVLLNPATAIAFSNPRFTALSGTCLGPLHVRAEDVTGSPSLLPANASIGLSSVPGVTFFSDAQCASPVTSVVLAAGAPETTFYFRSRATGSVALRASSTSLGSAVQVEQIVPTVRTGTCTMADGTNFLACNTGSPGVLDPSKAFLLVQAITPENTPDSVNVRCRLDAGTIDCSRAGVIGAVNVSWELVELASGVRVQRVDNALCAGTNLITLPQPVNLQQTFVLFTAEGGGQVVDANDYRTVRLVSDNQVEVLNNGDCAGLLEVQVVELQGAQVERGLLNDAGLVPSVTLPLGSSVDPARSFLLHSARFTGGSMLCGFQLRGQLTSDTITFTRGDGNDAVCGTPDLTAVAWERVQLPPGFTVQQVSLNMSDGQTSAGTAISQVDPARTFVFASSQLNGGAAFGETSFNGDDRPGAAGAWLNLSTPTRLDAVRGWDAGTARWTSYVVQLP